MARQADEYVMGLTVDSKGAEKSITRFGTATSRATEKIAAMVSQKGYLYYSMKRIASYTAIFSFFGGLVKMLGETIQLELALAEVNTLIDKTNQDAVDSYKQVSEALLRLNPHLGSSVHLTKGLYEIISAGVTDPEQAFELLVTSAKYAKVGLTDLATAASSLTAVMKAYGFQAETMREKSDVLFASVREGKYHTDELNAAIGKVLPTAATMGVSIEEVAAALAVMTQRGLDVNEASTSLNRMMISFLRPIDKAKARFQALGWQWGLNAFEGKGLIGALQDLETATARYSDLLPIVFRRQRALKGGFILQGQGLRALEQMYGRVKMAGAGAGIVQSEFAEITGTVAEEAKALHANLQQGFAGLLKYKGATAELVRSLSSFLRMLLEHIPALMRFGVAILTIRKALVLWNAVIGQAIILRIAENRLLIKGETFILRQAQARAAATKITKIGNAVMAATNIILTAALIVYVAVTWWITKKKEADERARKAAENHKKAMANVNAELAIMNEAYRKAEGALFYFNKEVERLAVLKMLAEMTIQIEEMASTMKGGLASTGNYIKAFKEFKKASKLNIPEFKEGWKAIMSLLHLKGFDPDAMKKAKALLQELALQAGITHKEALNASQKMREENEKYARALDSMSQKLLMLGRNLQLVNQEMQSGRKQLALRYTEEELRAIIRAIDDYRKGLTDLQARQLKGMFGIDIKEMENYADEIGALYQNLLWAAKNAYGEKSKKIIEDYTRTYIASGDEIKFSLETAQRRATALFEASRTLRLKEKADLVAWANKHKDEIEKILRHSANLPVEQREYFEGLEELRKKDKKSLKDWGDAYKTAYQRLLDNRTVMETKMQEMRNEYMGIEHEDIISQIERQKIAWVNNANKMLELAKKAGMDMVEAKREYEETMTLIQKVEEVARKTAMFRQLGVFLKMQKAELDALKKGAAERLRITEEKRIAAHAFVEAMGVQDIAFLAKLHADVEAYWDMIKLEAEIAKDALALLAQGFASVGRSISATATAFGDFLGYIGLADSGLNRLVGVLSAVGQGAAQIGQHLQAMKSSQGIGGIAQTIGGIAGPVGIAISAVTTAVGIFKALFGGKSEQEKAAEAAERAKKQLEVWVGGFITSLEYLGEVSEATAKKVYEHVQKGMPEYIAASKELPAIMNDTGLSMKNFADWTVRVSDVLHQAGNEFLDTEEAGKIFGETFSKLIEYAKEAGIEGSAAILAMIRKAKELGYEIKELNEYIEENLATAAEGLKSMIDWVAEDAMKAHDAISDLSDEEKKLYEQLQVYQRQMSVLEEGSAAWLVARDNANALMLTIQENYPELYKYIQTIEDVAAVSAEQLDNLALITAGVFGSMIEQGMPMLEILDQLSESVNALRERYEVLGIKVPNYLKPIFEVFEAYEKQPKFFKGLQGLDQVLTGLANSGFLTVEAFHALGREAENYYNKMTKTKKEGGFGFTDEKAIRMMYPLLQKMWWYAEQYGMKMPKWAEDAMKEAKGLGLKFEKPATDKLVDEMIRMNNRVLPHVGTTIREKLHEIIETLHDLDGYQHGTTHTPGGLANLHPGESVLPENVTSALKEFFTGKRGTLGESDGGGVALVDVYMDGQVIYRGMRPYIVKGGEYADFELAGEGVR